MADVLPLVQAQQAYREARQHFLAALGCPESNRDPLAEFSERLVAALVDGATAQSRVQRDYDVVEASGHRIQVRYLANPAGRWVNEPLVKFTPQMDQYAVVIIEALRPTTVLIFARDTLADVCAALGKRHPDQVTTLQLTQRNVLQILAAPAAFGALGARVFTL